MLPKVSAFFEFKLESSFAVSDPLIPNFCKWNEDSVDTFSVIISILGRSLHFSSSVLTGSSKVAVFVPKLAEYSVIPNFVIAFWKYSWSVLDTSRSSEIISLLLSPILSFSVLSSYFLSASVILDGCTPLSLISGLTVTQNFLLSVNFFNSLLE